MKPTPIIKTLCAAVFTTLLLSGCEDPINTNFGEGTLSIAIKDAPVDGATQVVLAISGIELRTYSGETSTIDFDAPQLVNLLDYQGTTTRLLVDKKVVTGGTYSWLRLIVDESNSYLLNGIGSHPLTIPDAYKENLRVDGSFTVPQDGAMELTLDFDLRNSIVESGGNYTLKPSLRLAENAKSGHISGTIPNSLMIATDCGTSAVYLYEGSNATPDDLDGTAAEPIDSSLVTPDDSTYKYTLGFHEAGNYTLAFTCKANLDNPESNDTTVTFSASADIIVTARETATHNF